MRDMAGQAFTGRNWFRMFYMINLSTIVVTVIIYFFLIFEQGYIDPWLGVLIGFILCTGAWYILETTGMVSRSPILCQIYQSPGLRWLDIILVILAMVVLYGTWRLNFMNNPIIIVSVLVFVNGLLGFFQLHSTYSSKTINDMEEELIDSEASINMNET